MLEHIFRNIYDIRIFDLMSDFDSSDCALDIDEIMNLLEYPDYEHIQVEDSVEHLVRQHILSVVQTKLDGKTGCKVCKYLDKLKIPRTGVHRTHIPETSSVGFVDGYYMTDNNITRSLKSAVFAHIAIVEGIEDLIKDDVVMDMTKDMTKVDTSSSR